MIKIFIALLMTGVAFAQLANEKGFPKWLMSAKYQTEQTSGIVLIANSGHEQQFLLVDDIGKIHRFIVSNDSVFTFFPVTITGQAREFVESLPKKDFEEITLDKSNGKVYLSIEGNGPDSRNIAGVFELQFARDDIYSDTVIAMHRLHIVPEEKIKQHLANNIGFEGVASDGKVLYLGLEGFQDGEEFADSTYIYIVDTKSQLIINRVPTKDLDIHTICGLYAIAERALLVVDRNNHKVHYIEFDEAYRVTKNIVHMVKASIPGYPELPYTLAIESISIDGNGFVYIIDDPWKSRFKPQPDIYEQLDEKTRKNFGNFVPIIYKFELSTFTKE